MHHSLCSTGLYIKKHLHFCVEEKTTESSISTASLHQLFTMHIKCVMNYTWAILPCRAKTTFGDARRIAFDLQVDMEEYQN